MRESLLFCAVTLLIAAGGAGAGPAVGPQARAGARPAHDRTLTLTLFFSPTCPHCHPVRALISRIVAAHPQVRAIEFNLAQPENVEKMAAAYQQYHVPAEEWGGTIAVFVGNRWWNDSDKILKELGPAVDELLGRSRRHGDKGTVGPGENGNGVRRGQRGGGARGSEVAGGRALQRVFKGFGVAAVAVAGLLDGVNPCALATLIFLISYLNYVKRTPVEVLLAGLLFAAAVFLTYLGIGLGFFRGLELTRGISVLSKLLYPVMAVGTLGLAGLSLRDYGRARRGAYREMTLKLPAALSRMSHGVIRGFARVPLFLVFAFLGGLAVSLLELFCTGQIYLPTLMYVWSTTALRARAFGLLILYAAMFTLPIVALAVMVYAGVSSRGLMKFAQKHTAAVKLATAVLFLALSAYLVTVSLRSF